MERAGGAGRRRIGQEKGRMGLMRDLEPGWSWRWRKDFGNRGRERGLKVERLVGAGKEGVAWVKVLGMEEWNGFEDWWCKVEEV